MLMEQQLKYNHIDQIFRRNIGLNQKFNQKRDLNDLIA